MPSIVVVAAVARNRVIGSAGDLPWRLPADMRHFKAVTLGKPMVMGRKTFDSIGRPLPGRRTIVVTRDPAWSADGVETAPSLEAALALASSGEPEEIVVAGGGEIYAQALPLADRMRLTWVEADPQGDAVFPAFDAADWRETARERHPAEDGRPAFAFVDYVRAGR
ncbi:dihydrofolate reductase [Thalassobaculum fulvum]|uniref:Dihydrofolate reductase n=1 Tax=Thalassobaculum fulvum TaxID=1633335 RepID=A0A918XYF1_9PROT|nr:dihydrofolate reductase [Thalassobaculum fulvum]GHD63702.1 dihydrofolate reductase [Thalassobaculum fulvum]